MVVPAEFVMDTSFSMRWLFENEKNPLSDEAWERLVEETATAHVPGLWAMEIVNVALRGPRKDAPKPSVEKVEGFFAVIRRMPLRFHFQSLELFIDQAVPLQVKYGLTPYDSAYLLLAKKLGHPLATRDKNMRAAAIAEGGEVVK
jgi:predicted nucleic acid-binding protein